MTPYKSNFFSMSINAPTMFTLGQGSKNPLDIEDNLSIVYQIEKANWIIILLSIILSYSTIFYYLKFFFNKFATIQHTLLHLGIDKKADIYHNL